VRPAISIRPHLPLRRPAAVPGKRQHFFADSIEGCQPILKRSSSAKRRRTHRHHHHKLSRRWLTLTNARSLLQEIAQIKKSFCLHSPSPTADRYPARSRKPPNPEPEMKRPRKIQPKPVPQPQFEAKPAEVRAWLFRMHSIRRTLRLPRVVGGFSG